MMEIFDNVVRVLMYVSMGLNIWGCVLSARTIKRARKSWENAHDMIRVTEEWRNDMRVNVAEEIFDKIEGSLAVHAYRPKSEDYAAGACDTLEWVDLKIDEVKEEYIPRQES